MVEKSKQTQAEKLAGEIADAILSGDLRPGVRLDEQTLADRYDVSRTPVREALRQLATTGLIDVRPRRSAVVAEVTPDQLETMFIAMAELEATCARLSAMRMTPFERRRLQAQHESTAEWVRTEEPERFATANLEFHALIYAGAHNVILSDMSLTLRRRLQPFRRAQFRSQGRLPRSFAEHEAVVQAILSGNVTAAHTAMLEHVSLVEESFSRLAGAYAA